MDRLFIATPRAKPYLDGYVRSIFHTQFVGSARWKPLPNLAIDIARNYLVQEAFADKATHLLWADVDATWSPEAVMRMMGRDLDIVTACIYKRSIPSFPTWGIYQGKDAEGQHKYSLQEAINEIVDHAKEHGLDEHGMNAVTLPETDHDLMEIDGCGSHFMLVKMDVYRELIPPYYKKTYHESGEDFYFCRLAKEAGYKIWGDKSVHTGHEVGTGCEFGIRTLLQYIQFIGNLDQEQPTLLEVGSWDNSPL